MQNTPFAAQQEQVNKFLQANRVLGAQMDQMQGTTRNIYDTVNMDGKTSYSFFSELPSKQGSASNLANAPATNLTDNRFEPGEGMVIKELAFINYEATAANIANLNIGFAALGLVDIIVGNQRVVKDLPLLAGATISAINNINTKVSIATEAKRYNVVRLFTNIVIPPQIQFFVNLRLPFAPVAATTDASASVLRCYLKGYGKLFNPRNNY
jgi:hypothetical protein